jgi:hypothetical protein
MSMDSDSIYFKEKVLAGLEISQKRLIEFKKIKKTKIVQMVNDVISAKDPNEVEFSTLSLSEKSETK